MAKYRETVCIHYISAGCCKLGREASHEHYCQKCGKYYPRARIHHINKKKQKLQKIRELERY